MTLTIFDLTQVNVNCSLVGTVYAYTFSNKTGNTLFSSGILEVNTSMTTFVEGNFGQTSNGTIQFIVDSNTGNSKSSPLNVGGCISINGSITVNLETQPQQGTSNMQLISYNCSQQVNISSSQIQVIPNYNGSSCDTINSQTINQQGSLGVSITSTLGNKCNGGKNLGLIIGLAVGIPCAAIAVGAVIGYLRWRQNTELDRRLEKLGNQMRTNY